MLRESGSDSRPFRLNGLLPFYAGLLALAAAFPGLTLFSGQVIKQFESYSLARSMAAVGWNPYATTIPCDGGVRWVLELPLFAGLGGIFARLAPDLPSVLPVLVFALFLFALARFRERLAPDSPILAWVAVASAPVFLRFSTQFLADPLAVALALLGAGFFIENRRASAISLFLLAVSVKPTVLPSILFFRWAFAPERDARRILPAPAFSWFLREAAVALILIAPFAAWSLSVKALGIPSPMHEGGLLAIGRDWAILGERAFYSKFFNWTVFKGVGFPLFLLAICGALGRGERELRLAAWASGIVPYWLLVRRLNAIHDYYSLSFFVPIAVLGAIGAARAIDRRPAAAGWIRLALLASVAQGVGLFLAAGLGSPWKPPVAERPIFCGKEMRAEELMGRGTAPGK